MILENNYDVVVVGSGPESEPPAFRRGGAMGGRMRPGMQNMTDEEREQFRNRMREMRERFRNASPEERERMRTEMREREMMFGGGRRGRGPGGGRGE